eukprot:Clim_evm41s203 gene=Clim_evmTU41s203
MSQSRTLPDEFVPDALSTYEVQHKKDNHSVGGVPKEKRWTSRASTPVLSNSARQSVTPAVNDGDLAYTPPAVQVGRIAGQLEDHWKRQMSMQRASPKTPSLEVIGGAAIEQTPLQGSRVVPQPNAPGRHVPVARRNFQFHLDPVPEAFPKQQHDSTALVGLVGPIVEKKIECIVLGRLQDVEEQLAALQVTCQGHEGFIQALLSDNCAADNNPATTPTASSPKRVTASRSLPCLRTKREKSSLMKRTRSEEDFGRKGKRVSLPPEAKVSQTSPGSMHIEWRMRQRPDTPFPGPPSSASHGSQDDVDLVT